MNWFVWMWGSDVELHGSQMTHIAHQLERGKILRDAEARGDVAFLLSELNRNQLTSDDLARLRRLNTPLEAWPDECLDDCMSVKRLPS